MRHDDLDRILAAEEPLQPPSGFAAQVMARVRQTGAAPPPLPSPWVTRLLGVSSLSVLATLCGWALLSLPAAETLRSGLDRLVRLEEGALAALADPHLALALGGCAASLAGTYLLVELALLMTAARR